MSKDCANIPGVRTDLTNLFSPSESLEMFRKICFTRYFELQVAEAYNKGLIDCYIYLSIGQESISAAVSTVISDCYIFTQHRAHSVYLAFGGDPVKLIDELLGRPTGCSGGKGGSSGIQDVNIGMIGYHELIGENVPLAVGAALGSGKTTVCFFGDGAAEEDYVLASMGFAAKHKLPILFVCEDNDLAILTPKSVRRNWEVARVAEAFGLTAVDLDDDPWLIAHTVRKFSYSLPALINCHTCRHYWHVGVGIDGPPKWDRLEMVKEKLNSLGLLEEALEIEKKTERDVRRLWEKLLRKQ